MVVSSTIGDCALALLLITVNTAAQIENASATDGSARARNAKRIISSPQLLLLVAGAGGSARCWLAGRWCADQPDPHFTDCFSYRHDVPHVKSLKNNTKMLLNWAQF
ncbi:MAG TPA: hypothetical protein VKT73_02055 [Xanthobacteraceae bacterium]|nr:hypothetical protein [Xanthobacteraceae bacterium]